MLFRSDLFSTVCPGILTICTYTEFAPFSYVDGGDIVGTDIGLLKAFAREIQLEVEVIKRAFAGLWEAPGKGDCDVSAAGMMEHEDRKLGKNAVWSYPYMLVTRSLLIRKSDRDILKGPKDFQGRKIVVTPTSSAHIDGSIRYEPLGATIIPLVPSQDEIVYTIGVGAVHFGICHLFFGIHLIIHYLLADSSAVKTIVLIPMGAEVVFCVVFRCNHPLLYVGLSGNEHEKQFGQLLFRNSTQY